MKLIALFLLIVSLTIAARPFAQTVTLAGKDLQLEEVLGVIEKQTTYTFLYKENVLTNTKRITLRVVNMPLLQLLDTLFKDQPLEYTVKGYTIFVSGRSSIPGSGGIVPSALDKLPPPVKVLVTDSAGIPLSGATVTIKKNKVSKVTDDNGSVTMNVNAGDILEISYIGYETRSVKLSANTTTLNITLQRAEQQYKEVVINAGIITRKKESFTGAVSSFTGQELRKVGNGNVLQSLKSLDPSFIINPSQLNGSNPNQLPSIQLRGTTAVTTSSALRGTFDVDPNQPLFILNGMESTLEQIVNLDINRIASITILKDAASTALYGSRAANGVVVVETKRPRTGDLRVNYTLDLRAEIPDLSDYNMMDAAEFLAFQKLAGYYDIGDRQYSQLRQDTLYNRRLRTVLSGVNTYWLNVPLRNALTAGHNINLNGGSEEFQYDVMLSYRNTAGVMKGSGRETWGASIDLAYRKKNVNFLNRVYVEGSKAKESPYGSFSDYVNMAPFYPKQDAYGNLFTGRYLETFTGPYYYLSFTERKTPNPIYNSTLNPKNENNLLRIQNNLSMIWDISREWRFTAGLQVVAESGDRIAFVPAADTRFDAVPIEQKGTYDYGRLKNWEYQGNAMFTYQRVFNEKHSLTGNLRTEVIEKNKRDLGFTAVGFPEGVDPNPAFASGYAINSKPAYAEVKARQVNALSSINYSYNNKYYADATFRMDGSTVFGSQKKYESFWAVGLGWTVNREKFLENANWISLLRLRANIGTNGNQQLGTFVSSSVYGYTNNVTGFGTGIYLNQLGAPDLDWQTTKQISTGLDLAFQNNKLLLTFNAFHKLTDPLVVIAPAPASIGVSNYAINAGRLTIKGLEAIVKYSPLMNPAKGIQWTLGVTGSISKSRYANFNSILEKENEKGRTLNAETPVKDIPAYLRRYLDGHSQDDIWAVRSLGIDPASGKEIMLKKDGTHTLYYDVADETVIGSAQPKVQGVISSNLNIKKFSVSIYLRYSLKQAKFNTAMFNKVENITLDQLSFNQDKRALYERWKQPGDVANFRSIYLSSMDGQYNLDSPPTSRFIQEENFLSGESLSIGYEMSESSLPWLQKLRIRTMRINAIANELFRLSNITAERGTDYPFAKTYSLSLNVFF